MLNNTEATVSVPFKAGPILADMNIKQVSTSIAMCPASILAKRRIIRANGFVKIPKNSMNGIMGTGTFNHQGTSGQKISFQYALVPKILTARNVQTASTIVIAIFPVTFAPPGNIGINPIRLFMKIKKKAVSR